MPRSDLVFEPTLRPAAAMELADVAVRYGRFVAVHNATFTVATGECVALVGPNGHGKSSLVSAIAGLVPREGVVRAFGTTLPGGDATAAVAEGISLVPERRHLYSSLSVRDNIMLGAYAKTRRILATRSWKEVSHVLEIFPELETRLGENAGVLSGGQQQMVALARALASRPRMMLLDEPCLGLAEVVIQRVYEVLETLKAAGVTVLIVEENPVRAVAFADRIIDMYNGTTDDRAQQRSA